MGKSIISTDISGGRVFLIPYHSTSEKLSHENYIYRKSSLSFLFSFSFFQFSLYLVFVAKRWVLYLIWTRVHTLSRIRTLTFVRKEKSCSMLSFCARGKVPCLVNRTLDGLLCVKWIWNLFCATSGCIGLRKLILHWHLHYQWYKQKKLLEWV